jgi:hypothetical protein
MQRKKKLAFGAKTEFVKANPNLSAAEVVKKAAESGITMTVNHVYNVRSEQKRKAKGPTASAKPKAAKVGRPKGRRRASPVPKPNGNLEGQLRRAIAEMGLARARVVFAEVEAAFAG